MQLDAVYKALADASRRKLLEALLLEDGQSLSQLETLLPDMTRFGVMKHLKVLVDANLVTTHKVGREKHHYLNPMPIQLVYDRWVTKFNQPIAQQLAGLKYHVEQTAMSSLPDRIYEIVIQASPEAIWDALTSSETSPLYYFETIVKSDWQPGAAYTYSKPDGFEMITGKILEIDPPHKLVQTFQAMWPEGLALPETKVTWTITDIGGACHLRLVHEGLPDVPLSNGLMSGWATILSALKTLLETGEPLKTGVE